MGFWRAALLGLLLCTSLRAEVLHLVTGDEYAPFTGKALPGQGMLTQVVQAALAEQGLAMTLDWQPWNR
ncbi:amino acid ABC transporter substrate-binding protein, partial [Ectopseudomonas khazarica]